MAGCLQYVVSLVLMPLFKPTEASLQSGLALEGRRTWRDVSCRNDLEYMNGNICCLNCPAGTRLISPCTRTGEKGKCEECDYGTYTEHTNSLTLCLKCTQCRSDQEIVRACTHTQDAKCQCKAGGFCAPDQACEVCKKCTTCEKDEEIVRNCTSTNNTECKKIQPKSGSASANAWVLLPLFLVILVIIVPVVICVRRRCTDSQRNLPAGLKAGQQYSDNSPTEDRTNREPGRLSCSSLSLPRQLVRVRSSIHMEDERKVLCESLSSSASNSQHSLTVLPSYAFSASTPQANPMSPMQPNRREDEPFPKLLPVNGDESLRKCFEYFEEMDIDLHRRFFRLIGLNDNVIKSKEYATYEDKIHELLNIWVEKEGRSASLNDLLKALLDLNQRRTAENVKENAVCHGHYVCEEI